MMKKDRIKEISTHLSVNRTNYMLSFRGNLHEFLNEPDMTVYKLADEANLPYSTLNSLLYGNSNDTKLSTAVALARAFGISVAAQNFCQNFSKLLTKLFGKYFRYL
jgi:predicted transcriptional regulator|nr:MAG TPA: addiction module antidote protein [Caudoviricetes sp.]